MKILFVHPAAVMSISDVSRGYRAALERRGHTIADYQLRARYEYHIRAIPKEMADNATLLSRQACETILNEAMYHEVDYVLIISGLNVHPIALWLLGKVGIPAAVILTESPYDDQDQKTWTDLTHVNSTVDLTVFTNDRHSAEVYGWNFLPPSFDANIHHPVELDSQEECDVLMVGTGWADRQAVLEAVDWTGINLVLYGVWPSITQDSPLFDFYRPLIVNNEHTPKMYCSAKVNLNIHRKSDVAKTPGPRTYELAACGAFQISDARQDIVEMFGDSIPTFETPQELGALIRKYLADEPARKLCAARALDIVCREDFDARAAKLESILEEHRVEVPKRKELQLVT